MKKFICTAALVCVSMAPGVSAQDRRLAQSPGATDPFSISVGSSFSASGAGGRVERRIHTEAVASDFQEALELVRQHYAGRTAIDTGSLTSSGITAMLKTLDPHSNYYNADEFQELLGEHASEYSGTGTSMAGFERNGTVDTYFLSAAPGSPAARAGVRFGDRLMSINDEPASGREPRFARQMLRGPKGTTVKVTVERADTLRVEALTITRDRIHEPAVPAAFLFGEMGYIDLTNGFSNATFEEFDRELGKLRREGARSLIIDLRGNGGGILEQAIKIAERLLPEGSTIASQKGRYSSDEKTWRSRAGQHDARPIVLLVDEQTASASEVLAGALQDNDRALIVGTRTFGKGLVQSVLKLPDGAGLTLTAARYYTPTGRSIQREYSETGLYDYYHHRGTVDLDKPLFAAKTITNRIVYGGDGITPDERTTDRAFTPERISLLDPIFHFVRDTICRNPEKPESIHGTPVIFDTARFTLTGGPRSKLVEMFADFIAEHPEWHSLNARLQQERAFVADMLNYYFTLAAKGPEIARRITVESDPQFKQALKALPQAAALAASAAKARHLNDKKAR